MKRNLSSGIIITLLLTTLGVYQGMNPKKLDALVTAQSINIKFDCIPVGQIIQADDNVQRRRSEWVKFSTTSEGVILCAGDRLRIEDNSSAEVQCFDNNTNIKVSPKIDWLIDDYCHAPNNLIPGSTPIPRPRGSSNQLNIVSPRNTSILSLRPTFYWNSVEGASYYQVKLEGYQINWTESKITNTQLTYPPAEPELKYGNTYALIISAYSEPSFQEIAYQQVNFSIPNQDTVKQIYQSEQQIQKNFTGEAKLLALATLYQHNNLNVDAIKLLEQLQQQGVNTADLTLRLSQLYVRVQQYNSALESYQKAFELAQASENLGVQMEAAHQIGQLYTVMNNEAESEHWLAIAIDLDKQLKEALNN